MRLRLPTTGRSRAPARGARARRSSRALSGARGRASRRVGAESSHGQCARPCRRRSAGERRDEGLARGDRSAELTQDRALDRCRPTGLDQLPAHRPQGCMSDCREPQRPIPGEGACGRAQQRVAIEALVKTRRIVLEREHEAGVHDALARLGADDDASIGSLPRGRGGAVCQGCLPAAGAAHQAEAIWAERGDDVLDHGSDASGWGGGPLVPVPSPG